MNTLKKKYPAHLKERARKIITAKKAKYRVYYNDYFYKGSGGLSFLFPPEGEPEEDRLALLTKSFPVWMLTRHLAEWNLHMGFREDQTSPGFFTYTIGFHDGITQIDVRLIVYHMRRNFKLLIVFLIKNFRMCFVTYRTKLICDWHKVFFGYHTITDLWYPGTISNFSRLSWQPIRKMTNFIKRIPQLVVVFGFMAPGKIYDTSKEAQRAGIPIITFLDSNADLLCFNFFIPLNTKHIVSVEYCVLLLTSLIKRAHTLKKTKFLRKPRNFTRKKS